MRLLVLLAALIALVALSFPATAPAPNEGGGGGGYPNYCGPANDYYTWGHPVLYLWGPDGGWAWRYCSYGVMTTTAVHYTVEYGYIDGCNWPWSTNCWRWRRF